MGRYFLRVARRGTARWHSDRQVERDGLRRLSRLSLSGAENKRDVYMCEMFS